MSEVNSTPFNPLKSDPTLTDVLDQRKKEIFLSMNCHHVGTIQSFNPANQTAVVSINYKKTFAKLNPFAGVYNSVLVDYPLAIDCPVICLGGGDASLTFPIKKGDECLVLFNDRDLDNWFQGAGNGSLASSRLHSFSDGIALVGLRSLANVIDDYDGVRAVLVNDQAMVGVGPILVKIANNSTTLNTLLQTLVSNIETLVTNVEALVAQTAAITVTAVSPGMGTSGPPANAAAIAAVGALLVATAGQLTATGIEIAGLLE